MPISLSLPYFGRKPRLNGRPIPAHSSHIQIYVSRLEFYDRPAARRPLRRSPIERGAKPPRASDSAAARKIFPIDSGHRRKAEKRGFVARVEIELNLELLLSQWYKNISDQCNLLRSPPNLAMTNDFDPKLVLGSDRYREDNDLLLPMQ